MTPASMEAKLNPNSSLRRFFGAAMNQVDEFLDFINMITVEGLRAFWGRRKLIFLIIIEILTKDFRRTITIYPHRQLYGIAIPPLIEFGRSSFDIQTSGTIP